jgi:hypothetical protein
MSIRDLERKLQSLDEILLLELLEVDSYDLVEAFEELIEENREELERKLNDF